MGAKQAVREQALPFCPSMNTGIYGLKAYQLAMKIQSMMIKVKLLYHQMMNLLQKLNGMICLHK